MKKPLQVVGIIPARLKSQRLPEKLLIPIAGKTVIQRTYENALRCKQLDDLIVATDSQSILEHVHAFGGKAYLTSENCRNGTDRLAEVISQNPSLQQVPYVVNIQGDEPFLEPEVIQKVIEALRADEQVVVSTPVTPIKTEEEALDPAVVKCVRRQDGDALYFSRTLIPSSKKPGYQPETPYYRHIGVYGYKTEFLLLYTKLPATPLQLSEDLEQLKILEYGYRIKTVVVDSMSIGIDEPTDIKKVEFLLCKQNTSSSPEGSVLP
ncbi:3-deoxy-manno-octulosonate cytidylyltransferase [Parachlamydia sp. AcF125]|uniref:3-deoxy-manno-octulosonate cytidylyltransferase n=1 Tax=Parachlamydia sp. AcF125 TaxID=2795736 RepID=UPI001BC9C67D|nr:3-deoxy-manno-octulosonate cytidylyltransferase [Parachlamydia sp. AcF125]MBS4168311.1 8-amino-3,8-dideoxy-manno-octulosonate cytidylyltransferase [Parachlamydia sp. AcF125]